MAKRAKPRTRIVRVYRRTARGRSYPELRVSGRFLDPLALGFGDIVAVEVDTARRRIVLTPERRRS